MAPPLGEWEEGVNLPPIDSKVVAIHACLTNLGQVLYFHCRSYPFWTRLYDPVNNSVSDYNLVVPKWPIYYEEDENNPSYPIQPSKIFCSGHTFLPDGKILFAGGELNNPYPESFSPTAPDRGLRYSFIFDPANETDAWTITGPENNPFIMKKGRWYPTLTLLNDGTVLTVGGLTDEVIENPYDPGNYTVVQNRLVEIYIPSGMSAGWKLFNDPAAILPIDISYSYPDAHVIPVGSLAGKVFYATTQSVPGISDPVVYTDGYSQIFDPFATGSGPYFTAISNRRTTPSEASSGVLLPFRLSSNENARVLLTGGWWENFLNRIDLINLDPSTGTPLWESNASNMTYARADHNAILLPDRSLLFVGGVNSNGSVLIPELLDTDNLDWISNSLPQMPVARRYHSIGILLPDARILMGGGRVEDSGDVEDDTERRLSIYKPGYLMDGDRPVLINTPSEITYNELFSITVDGNYALDSIALMKPGSVTHGNNMDQRYIELSFEQIIGPGPTAEYSLTAPLNSFIAPPGYYMLFVLKDKSESNSGYWKILSVAKFIKLS
ncbi:MAG: DUF1929 domain-containing protein [Ignavibacteriae bacterium]|nr:DUF1929 domain-containing protein [Ignavibacteriota bacterium]